METQTQEQKPKEIKKQYGSFLKDQIISVKPIEALGKWGTLLVKGEEKRKDPFLFDKVKRSYVVHFSQSQGGRIKSILDNQAKVLIRKYEMEFPEGMTEQQFFEKELGYDLNPMLKTNNFWKGGEGRVVVTKEGLRLDLSDSYDMIRYKILLSCKDRISPSYEERLNKATYEFMLVDENKVINKRVEEAQVKAQAYIKYGQIIETPASAIGFIRSMGRAIPASATEEWMKGQILEVVEKNPQEFLNIVSDPRYDVKIFIQKAVEAGAITRMNDKRYILDNGIELGDLVDTCNYLINPDNQEVKLRIKAKIEMMNRQ